ncbi:MAG: hypothetical protein ACXWM1_01485 [Candidatus Binataceae bacterium]
MTTASAEGPAALPQRMRNSLLRYSPAVVLLAILVADSSRHTDPDLWGHIRFGQAFIADRHLIDRDPYSYSAANHLWRDHEWLAEVVMAAVYNAAGVVGLKLWKFIFTALTVLFIADSEASTGAPPSVQLPVLLVASVGLILQTQFRPQMFTLVCLSALIALLARDNYRRGPTIWLAVPLMALWANPHGGFVAGIVTLALYSGVAALCDLAAGEGLRRAIRLALVTLAAIAATLVNPYGIGMWKAVLYALSNPYTRGIVNDWQPLAHALALQWHQGLFGALIYVAAIGLIAALALAFVASPRAGDLPLVAIAAFMSIAAFQSVRNMALAVIAVSGPLARHLAVLSERRRRGAPAPDSRSVNQWLILAACVVLIVQGGLFSSRLAQDEPYPAGAVSFMRAHGLHGNLLCDFGWGEYLIWHTFPSDRVFIDGRNDTVYPPEVVHDYLLFRFNLPGGAQVLDNYPHDFVLIPSIATARHLMEQRHDWKLLYRDRDALLYARASAPVASLKDLPVTGAAPAGAFP